MKTLKFIASLIVITILFSCSKNKDRLDEKCFCIQYKNQKCLKYYQTVNTDPWGSWMQTDQKIENGVKHFCDSLGVKILSVKISKKKFSDYTQCECSYTGKIICVKVNQIDATRLKAQKFIDN